jgi:hypothetical protein
MLVPRLRSTEVTEPVRKSTAPDPPPMERSSGFRLMATDE